MSAGIEPADATSATMPSTVTESSMRLVVDPRLLDHFGLAMYNSIDKALGELVANAYDADASTVFIECQQRQIRVTDDGIGMTPSDVEDTYLHLGNNRRLTEGELTNKGRALIGHKGIGKLAGLGIANVMEVSTTRDGKRTEFVIVRRDFETEKALESYRFPVQVSEADPDVHGTSIILTDIGSILKHINLSHLRGRLAAQLPAAPDWSVFLNGVRCRPPKVRGTRVPIDHTIAGVGRVRGYYIVTNGRVKDVSNRGFAIRVRGRIVQEPSLLGLHPQAPGLYALSRVVGELEPSFIDPTVGRRPDEDFVINTSRDALNPQHEHVQALLKYGRNKLLTISQDINRDRVLRLKDAALSRHPEFAERLSALSPSDFKKVDVFFTSIISRLAKNETEETIDQLLDLVVRYYESDSLRSLLTSIRESSDDDVARLAQLLGQYGMARVSEVAQILDSQLQIIDLLREKVLTGALEREIHKVVSENIWLLRDGLTYWFDNKSFATQLRDALSVKLKFAATARPDLVCYDDRTLGKPGSTPSRLVVVEFKRPGVEISSAELSQVFLYKRVLEESLAGRFGEIEVIILGDRFDPGFDRAGLGPGYSILSYLELLENARDRYRDLYEKLRPT